ncbi:B12-binding domain-containing radical SAM protein [Candidatus Bathyarchaeota archaeon]|nr:B12-binding domain-containing radical SAM protein [Candidatus Bathyarchaeota archaeon]
MKPLIVDTLASGKGTRLTTRDVIGAGPRTVAGVLEKHGMEPTIVPVEKFLRGKNEIKGFDVILISGMTPDISAMGKTIRKWRRGNNGSVIIGGPASSEPERVLKRTGADIAITGEGEMTLSELIDLGALHGATDGLDKVLGISYRIKKTVTVNPLRSVQSREIFKEYQASTDTITGYDLYKSARVYVEILRGCSNYHRARIGPLGDSCTFCEQCTELSLTERYDCPVGIPPGCGYCSVPSLYGPPKSRQSELIINEVRRLLDLGVHRIVLSAPGFLDYGRELLVEPDPLTDPRNPEPNYDEIKGLLSGLTELPQMKSGNASLMIENIKASLVTKRAANLLGSYLRDTPVSVGFETGSDSHSVQLGRPDTPSETLVSLRRLKEAGMKPYVYFIHGLPGQTIETANETVDKINRSMKLGADRVILYSFSSLPASAFSGCPSGSPAVNDPNSKIIYDAAQKANQESKEELVGKTFKVVVANRYDRDHRFCVAYPMLHGPVVLVEEVNMDQGEVVDVIITGVASTRMVYGRII